MGAVLGPLIAAALAAAAPGPASPSVFVVHTMAQEKSPGHPFVEAALVSAFSNALEAAATETLFLRRFDVIGVAEGAPVIAANAPGGSCRTAACVREVARRAGATHALHSRLTKTTSGACVAFVELEDLVTPAATRREGRDVWPCSAESLEVAGDDLGRTLTTGPRAPIRPTVALTTLGVAGIDVPDVAAVSTETTVTSTGTRRRRGFSQERALELYKEKHLFVFDDDARPEGFFIAQNGKLVGECEVRRQARAPISSDMREFCEGNLWEWAWAAFPVGAVITAFSADDVADGGALRFLFGVALSAVSATLALALDVDAVDLGSGQHFSDRKIVESLVASSNTTLREVLDLTQGEVEASGMRR